MSLSDYFDRHEEQAFVAKALATAVAVTLIKHHFPGLVSLLFLLLPLIFLVGIRLHAAASGVDAMDLLREHITFFPVLRSEDERRSEVKPWVTYGIILANVLIFYFIEANLPAETISNNLVFLPRKPDAFNVPLSAFTSLFLHASNGHLWGNMTFLWVVGSAVERRVGRLRFLLLYLVTGLIGGFAFILVEYLAHARAGHALGASGAIAGIMGIFAIRCYFKSMTFPIPILGIFSLILPISLKVRLNSLLIMALFFLSDLSGGVEQISGEGSMIGHWAHLGGMISGMLIAGHLKLGDAAVEERHLEIGIKASQAAMGYGGGERSMQIALDRSPNNVDALLGMARLKTKFHASPEGQEFYEKSLGLLLVERPAEVVGVFREYLGKYLKAPSEPELAARLAAAMGKAGETGLQISCLERLVESAGPSASQREKALYQLAMLLEFTSCFEAARSCFARFAFEYPESFLADKARDRAAGEVHRPAQGASGRELHRHSQPTSLDDAPESAQAAAGEKAPSAESCPSCGTAMAVRRSSSGPRQGVPFWVCGAYPACRTFHPVAQSGATIEPGPVPESYRLIMDGTIGFTYDPEEAKQSLVRLLRCGRDQVERLCNGSPTVLKRGLDHALALKYKEAISRTGALCTMEQEEAPFAAPAQPASPRQPLQARQEVDAAPPAPVPSFSCPKCGKLQEKGESCVACGVYFAKAAQQAEREFQGFRDNLDPGTVRALNAPGLDPARGMVTVSVAGKKFVMRQSRMVGMAAVVVLCISCYFLIGSVSDAVDLYSPNVKLANAALKTQIDAGGPDLDEIKKILSAHDFKSIESQYDGYFKQYQKNVQYEWFFQEAYNLFTPKNNLSVEDLDLWVATTGSPAAYAARGAYKAQQGFLARGDAAAGDTPQSNIDEMQRLHNEAAKDLQIAIAANPHLIPAYTFLLRMAKTSGMPFTAKEMIDQAEKSDKRSFYLRHEYLVSLQPRWGGSHDAMSAYAKSAVKYTDLNPRLWSLQGAADADRGDEQYRAGDYDAAVKLYTNALRFGDRLAWLKDRAACYNCQDKSAEAVADYRRVLSYDPNDRTAQIGVRGGRP